MDRLSYSSLQTFKSCKRKWAYKKLLKLPNDVDYQQSEALNFGKAYHEILEACGHENCLSTAMMAAIDEIITNLGQMDNYAAIINCVNCYLSLRKKYPLRMIKAEYELKHVRVIGFVDTILIDSDGKWWIQDLKTARTISKDLQARLAKDAQLNLYASFAEDIARDLGLNIKDFQGCLYTVVNKNKKPEIHEYVIPLHMMNPEFYRAEIEAAYAAMEKITEDRLPSCNFSACFNYFSPCEFWSKCYGQLYSDSKIEVRYGN